MRKRERGGGLKFTFAITKEGIVQFLDPSLSIGHFHVRVFELILHSEQKRILGYRSVHSIVIRRGSALSCGYAPKSRAFTLCGTVS